MKKLGEKNKIRLAHLQLLPLMSGVQRAMFDILRHLDQDKFEILVICQKEGELTEQLKKEGIKYRCLPWLRREINPFCDVLALIKLANILKKENIHILHTHSSKTGFLGRAAASIVKLQIKIHTVQGFAFHEFSNKITIKLFSALERFAGLLSDKIIIVNQKDYDFAISKKIISREKMLLLPNGIELNGKLDTGYSLKKELGYDDKIKIIGSVGRLWKQKAPQYLIRAVPDVIQKHPEARFVLTGDGPLEDELKKLAASLGVENYVHFLGWRQDARKILADYDIFVQTSLWEGLSISILEAMAAQKQIVVSDIKGNNELIKNEVTGLLFPPKDSKALAQKIIFLLDHPEQARKMAENARKEVAEKYDIKNISARIETLYLNLFEKNYCGQ